MTLNELAKSAIRLKEGIPILLLSIGISLCITTFLFLGDKVPVLCLSAFLAYFALIAACIALAVTYDLRYACKYIDASSIPVLEVGDSSTVEAREVNEIYTFDALPCLTFGVVDTSGEVSVLYSLTDCFDNVGTLHVGDKIKYITFSPTAEFKEDCSEYLGERLMRKLTDLKIVVKINGVDPYEEAPLKGLAKEVYDDIIKTYCI